MGKWCAVASEYRMINRWIAGTMNLLTRYINCSGVRANSARMLLWSALPQCQDSIRDKDYQEVHTMMKTIIDGSRCWMENTLEWASMERKRFVVLDVRSLHSDLASVMHNRCIGSIYRQKREQHGHCPIQRMSVNRESMICGFVSTVITQWFGCCYAHPMYCYLV